MIVLLKLDMTFKIMGGRNCKFDMLILNLLLDQSFPNGKRASKKAGK
jgi:hypothetical protein